MSLISGIGPVLSGVGSSDPLGGIASGIGSGVADLGLDAVDSWVLQGTEAALKSVAQLIGQATAPQLESSWFSGTYWQVAGLASLLTLPFLFAAAIQALLRGDLMLLARAAFMYLPVALLGVTLAAPLVMLLLSATDQMCSVVAGGGSAGGAQLLDQAAAAAATTSALDGSPFFAFVVGLIALAAALALTLELMIRAAAVYVVVLMLPLSFAALVWPARRIWAIRTVELLISLILSKFVIVAVLSLAGAAFGQDGSTSTLLTAMTLLLLSTFAPWALMRLLPFTEVAAAAAGGLRAELTHGVGQVATATALAEGGMELASMLRRSPQPDPSAGWDASGSDSWRPGSGGEDETYADDESPEGDGDGGPTGTSGSAGPAPSGDGDGGGASGPRGGGGPSERGGAEAGGSTGRDAARGTSDDVAHDGSGTTAGGAPVGGAVDEQPGTAPSGMNRGADSHPLGASGSGGSRQAHQSGSDSGGGAGSAGRSGRERPHGSEPLWQTENQTWTPMTLGPSAWTGLNTYDPEWPAPTPDPLDATPPDAPMPEPDTAGESDSSAAPLPADVPADQVEEQ